MNRYVVDTSVFIEYLIADSPYRDKIEKLFTKSSVGSVELYVTTSTISEILYISSRLYEASGFNEPNIEALNYVAWLKSFAKPIEINFDIAIQAGELKKKINIALTDCYVIASAKMYGGKALFKTLEKEMIRFKSILEENGVIFLDNLDVE